MNEIFEFRRFGALALKWYRENIRLGLIFLTIMGVITFLFLCKFKPFFPEYTQLADAGQVNAFIQRYREMYISVFWGLFGIFALMVAFHSLRDFIVKDRIVNTLLLPASTFEKYLLAFLNSTVIIFVVYLFLFYALASVTSSYKFIGISHVEGNEHLEVGNSGPQTIYAEIGNVLRLNDKGPLVTLAPNQKERKYGHLDRGLILNFTIMWFLYLVSLGMWGSVTFRKHPFILTFLLHAVFMLLLIGVSIWIASWILKREPGASGNTLSFYGVEKEPTFPSIRWIFLFYIFPLAYQFVIWMKLKTKQI